MTFAPPELEQPIDPPASSFVFSGSPTRYRLHCARDGNNMMLFLGMIALEEWVLWGNADLIHRSHGLLDVEWVGQDGGGKFKIRGNDGKYVKWSVSGFVLSGADDATEFMLREV